MRIMSIELKKLKHTGFFPAFLIGAFLTASFPVVNTAVRTETFTGQPLAPLDILMGANWQMMSMLNLFFLVIGACILFHTEFSEHGMQKMETLPIKIGKVFFCKTAILFFSLLFCMAMETAGLAVCGMYWFSVDLGFWKELTLTLGYETLLLLPSILLMIMIASFSPNMWVSLGIGVIGIFIVTLLPTDQFVFALFPFSMPFQTLQEAEGASWSTSILIACGAEIILLEIIQAAVRTLRRNLS